ncbi:hypothetical protein [Streptomyces hesseae]|uniref:Sigma-like protein n=1 Tax=Streptomyces hesseae TaxID=3075519 RepID=A0ABU2SGK0_9ACTN|nr:hypothetical protein [Streptomyces sp. DSM 40473]MDT0448106.1 hypothetical protein [Streptomyces sp. DSM 40473]
MDGDGTHTGSSRAIHFPGPGTTPPDSTAAVTTPTTPAPGQGVPDNQVAGFQDKLE